MTAVISLSAASSNLLFYFEDVWSAGFDYNGNGAFDNPSSASHTDWGAGNTGDYGVVLEGSPLNYAQGGLQSTSQLDTLEFGSGYSYSTTSGSALSTVDLSIDLGGAAPTSIFNQTIYTLSHGGALEGGSFFGGSFAGLYDYFAEVGTEQVGTTGDDVLYSFEGSDALTGGAGADAFVFDLSGFGLLDTAFTTIGNDTITDFASSADQIFIGGLGYDDFSDLSISDVGGNAVIDLGSYGSITVAGVSASALDASNVFVI